MAKLRIPVMVLLFTAAAMIEAVQCSSLTALTNKDIWWHLRIGLWMLQTHALPHNGLYSQSSGLPWIASSWAYETLLALGYKLLELRFLPVLLMSFKTALAVAAFFLAGGLRGRFWLAVALSATVQWILGALPLGPGHCSVILFAIELFLLFASRRTGSPKPLFWLPPLFLVWANLDVQFVYGVGLLLLFTAALVVENLARSSGHAWFESNRPSLPLAQVGMIGTLSLIATLFTPYACRPYGVFFAITTGAASRYLPDFRAMSFHQPQDYALLLLTVAAFLALGLRRSRDPFQIALLAGCALLSFHAQRDLWLVALAAVAVIAEPAPGANQVADANRKPVWKWRGFVTAGMVIVLLVLVIALRIPRSREALLARVARTYPVAACNYIREHQLPQPVFNAYEWGGFLTWYLPEFPVAIDGRADLYGDDFVIQYSKVMNADLPYTSNSALTRAATILLPRNSMMADVLSAVPAFRVAYSDSVAVVLTKQEQ